MKNKILIFSHALTVHGGGAGIVAFQNALRLSKLGFKVDVLTHSKSIDSASEIAMNDAGITLFKIKSLGMLWPLQYLLSLDLDQYAAVLLNDPASIFIMGIKNNSYKKCLAFLHGSEPEHIYENPKLIFRFLRFRFFYDRALNNVNKIIAPSFYMKNKFLTRANPKMEQDKIEVSYAGISDVFFGNVSPKRNLRNELNIDKESKILLSVSRITEQKGYFHKLHIFKKLISSGKDWFWIIIGVGPFLQELKKIVEKLNLSSRVIFIGALPNSDLPLYYKAADLFWLLSQHDESFGLVYLEAQSSGCPVLGYNRAGVKEAVLDNISGFLVDNDDQAFDILLNESFKNLDHEDISKAVMKSIEKNNFEKLVLLLKTVINSNCT